MNKDLIANFGPIKFFEQLSKEYGMEPHVCVTFPSANTTPETKRCHQLAHMFLRKQKQRTS